MISVKFCGMRRAQDIEYANECRPDYVGFILSDGFKRSVTAEEFSVLQNGLDKNINKVGVFVNEPLVNILNREYNKSLDVIQLHGNETEDYIKALHTDFSGEIWKAVRAKSPEDIERYHWKHIDKLLIDSFSENGMGGTGVQINTDVVKDAKITKPFFIAGGITAENIGEIIEKTRPFGVDISSGIETDGVKDLQKMKKIMSILREDI